MSDQVQIALIASIGPTTVGLVVAYLNYLNGRKIESVHTLVNSQATEQLRIGMVSARSLFIASPTPENKVLSEIADAKYNKAILQAGTSTGGQNTPA